MGQPFATVVIPFYNAEELITPSVESALQQRWSGFEVVAIDDGSDDRSAECLHRISNPCLRVIHREHQGLSSTLNAGVAAAQGCYLGFLDADDIWLENKLAWHVAFLEAHPEADVTFSWSRAIDEHGRHLPFDSLRWRGALSFGQLLSDYVIRTMSAVVMRRTAFERAGGFSLTLPRCIDLDFFLRVALLRPNNIHAIPETLTLYRRHSRQRTRSRLKMQEGWNQVLESMRRLAPVETAAVERVAISNMLRYWSMLAYENAEFRPARQLLGESFRSSPTIFVRDARNWKMGMACLAHRIFPSKVHFALERLAGFNRSHFGE